MKTQTLKIANHGAQTSNPGGIKLIPFVLLIGALLITACSPSGGAPMIGVPTAVEISTSTPMDQTTASATIVPEATTSSEANNQASNPKCDALFLANYNIGMALAVMVNLTANTDYSAYTKSDSPVYLDFAKIRSNLDTLATLPDPSAADALIVGKPSEAIQYFHQLSDLAEADVKNQGKPFVDTNPAGVKLIGIDTPWAQHAATFSVAMGNVCKNYQAPADLLAGTPVATVDPQAAQTVEAQLATVVAAGASIQATLNAGATAYPEPTETPAP